MAMDISKQKDPTIEKILETLNQLKIIYLQIMDYLYEENTIDKDILKEMLRKYLRLKKEFLNDRIDILYPVAIQFLNKNKDVDPASLTWPSKQERRNKVESYVYVINKFSLTNHICWNNDHLRAASSFVNFCTSNESFSNDNTFIYVLKSDKEIIKFFKDYNLPKFELTGLLKKVLAQMRLDKLHGSIFDYTQWREDNEYRYEDFFN